MAKYYGIQARVCCLLLLGPAAAFSADTVWYLPPESRTNPGTWLPKPLRKFSGSIQSITDTQIEITIRDKNSVGGLANRTVSANKVVWIQPDWSSEGEAVAKAFKDYDAGDYDACLIPLSDYVRGVTVRWRKQIAYGQVMYAAAQRGKHRSALQIAVGFYDSGPPPCLYGLLPVKWSSPLPNSNRQAVASDAINHDHPAVRLIAASWLLSGSGRQQADQVLAKLEADPSHPLLARMAHVLRWRQTVGETTLKSLPDWESKIDKLPIALQPGAMTTIADRLQANGYEELALPWWLNVQHLGRQVGDLSRQASKKVVQLTEAANP